MKKFIKLLSTLLISLTCLAVIFATGCNQTPPPSSEKATLTSSQMVTMQEDSITAATFTFTLNGDLLTAVTGCGITQADYQIEDGTLTITQAFITANCTAVGGYEFTVTSQNGLSQTVEITVTQKPAPEIPSEPSVDGSTDNKNPTGPWIDA